MKAAQNMYWRYIYSSLQVNKKYQEKEEKKTGSYGYISNDQIMKSTPSNFNKKNTNTRFIG